MGQVLFDRRTACTTYGKASESAYHYNPGSTNFNSVKNYIKCEQLNILTVSSETVHFVINSINTCSSVGPVGILLFIITGLRDIIATILTSIFNWSLNSGILPSIWKYTLVTSILQPSPSDYFNYHPRNDSEGFWKNCPFIRHPRYCTVDFAISTWSFALLFNCY